MRPAARILETRQVASFQCLSAECEDTCCDGWALPVDQQTYEKYRDCDDPAWRASFDKLVKIQPAPTPLDYARIHLNSTTCAFLSEGLCAIQNRFGEDYLPYACIAFPRIRNFVDDAMEVSLDLGCPEATRLVLLNPDPLQFLEKPADGRDYAMVRAGLIDTTQESTPGKPHRYFIPARAFVVRLLQNRALSISKRILILGLFCNKLQEMALRGEESQIPDIIQAYDEAIPAGSFDPILAQVGANLPLRIETIVELILTRITTEFTNKRFLESYREFMQGLSWGDGTSMDQLGENFLAAHTRYYQPFIASHGHIFENYLVNYANRGLYPLGPQASTYGLGEAQIQRSLHESFILMAAHFSIIETLLVGMAGFYKEAFAVDHIIRAVSTATRTFEHSTTSPDIVLKALSDKGLNSVGGAAVMVSV
jgi:lysine-N-methylase